jgi:PAS domain S-box-containing protein
VELARSSDRYHELYEYAPVAYITLNRDGRITEANLAAAELFGTDKGSLVGRAFGAFCSERHADNFHRLRHRVASHGEREGCDLELLPRGGGRVPVHVETVLLLTSPTDPTLFRCTLFDLSDLRSAEEKLRKSEERFRQIAETIDDVFYVLERDGHVSYVSRAFETIWGRPAAELYANKGLWLESVHPADRQRVRDARHRHAMGEAFDEQYRIRRPDGEARWVRDRAFAVRDERGRGGRVIGVVHDATAERLLEEELRQAQKMEAVGALASGIAHDFNNLLHAILGLSTMASDEHVPPEKARALMGRVAGAAARGSELTRQLMGFVRKERIDLAPVELDGLVKGAASLMDRLLTKKIRLEVETRAKGCLVLCDRVQIEQMLLNLAANAKDAMPDGGTLTVETREGPAEQLGAGHAGQAPVRSVRLVVRDTGVGMDEATRQRIFEPFFTTKVLGRGTGLGLTMVLSTVKQLGGRIEVESTPGAGTVFTITLPCRIGPSEESRPAEPRKPKALRGEVLLVEDDPLVRFTVRHDLEELGLTVVEARSAREAVERFDAHRTSVDVLVTDVAMPEVTGPKLAETLRKERSELPVLYISANPPHDLDAEARDRPRVAVLQKPFGKEALADKIEALLGDRACRGGEGPDERGAR